MSNKKSNYHYNNPNTETLILGVNAILKGYRRIGVSKHAIRELIYEQTGQRSQSPYIHSRATYETYRDIGINYAIWVGENYPHIRTIKYAYKSGCAYDYIEMCKKSGRAEPTIAKWRCALAKIYGVPGSQIHNDIPPRLSENIKRYRTYSYEDFLYALEINENTDIIWIAYMTGCRRCELKTLTKQCFRHKPDGSIWLHIDGKKNDPKGGRTRDVYILPEHYDRLKRILAKYKRRELIYPRKKLKGVEFQSIRQMYAGNYYNAIARKYIPKGERMKNPDKGKSNSVPAIYRKRDGRIFDRKAMSIVSRSLGHNRVNVISISYSRFCIPMAN